MKNKYNARKVKWRGITFDSETELELYQDLLKLFRRNQVRVHQRFLILEGGDYYGKIFSKVHYEGDFTVGRYVIDYKGMQLPLSLLKNHLAQVRYPNYRFVMITKAPKYLGQKWVYTEDLNKIKKSIRDYKKKRGIPKMNAFHYKRLNLKPRAVIIEGVDINQLPKEDKGDIWS